MYSKITTETTLRENRVLEESKLAFFAIQEKHLAKESYEARSELVRDKA